MYQKFVFFGTILFFGIALMLSFQNCTTFTEKSAVTINNQSANSKILIYDTAGKEKVDFRTSETARFVFKNVIAICVSEPGDENTCVDARGFPKADRFSELSEGLAQEHFEKDIELIYPGKMMIYGFTTDPVYPVISSSLTVEGAMPKPASVE